MPEWLLLFSATTSISYNSYINDCNNSSDSDNISTLIQIIGRAVLLRNNCHTVLPRENLRVHISLYTGCLPNKELSYHELKYKLNADFKW